MFELEDSWECKPFGVNWVCHHYLSPNSRPSFIFTTARLSSGSDSLDFNRFEKAESSASLVNPAKKVSINRHVWIDSFHENLLYKEVLSRYQRTVCCEDLPEKFQVLVGLHSFKENYPKYANAFLKVIRSLSLLTDDIEDIRKLLKQQTAKQREDMQNHIQDILFESGAESLPVKKSLGFSNWTLWTFAFLCFVLAFFYIKLRQKKSLKQRTKNRKKR